MADAISNGDEGLEPETAARRLFNDPKANVQFSPTDATEARRAVEELGRLFDAAPGVFTAALEGARSGAETLTSDRLQGLAEIVQNADDAQASFVQFQLVDDHLSAVHDGDLVTLSDVLALTTPWLSTKGDDADATGRFGIGLMTLRALSDVLDIHSGPYHLRLGQGRVTAIEPAGPRMTPGTREKTMLSIRLEPGIVASEDVSKWLTRWDDSALLFLKNVRAIELLNPAGEPVQALGLAWRHFEHTTCEIAGSHAVVERRQATAPDGRKWLVYSTEVPKPPDLNRLRKASGRTVPLGLAIPLQPGDRQWIHAGLPVTTTAAPVRANAQFDPITSRTGLADTPWNRAQLQLLGDMWVEMVSRLLEEKPRVAWTAMPLSEGTPVIQQDADGISTAFEHLLRDRSRADLAYHGHLAIGGQRVPVSALAFEERALERVIDPSEIAAIAGLSSALPLAARDPAARWRAVLEDWRSAGAPLPPIVTVADAISLLADNGRSTDKTIALAAVAIEAGHESRLTEIAWVTTAGGNRIVPPSAHSVGVLTVARSGLAKQLGLGVGLAGEHLAPSKRARTVLAWLRELGAVIDDPSDERVVRLLAAAGRAGERVNEPLTDEQLRALRDAFEQLKPDDRAGLGPSVGRAISIAAYRYDARGKVVRTFARPSDMYQSRSIDREPDSFAIAADRTPGLLWTDNRYVDQLRSSLGRVGGLGAQKFLGLLGVERVPKLKSHAGNWARYTDPRLGLGIGATGSPKPRERALRALNATYTLDDIDSPDLRAVVADIATERSAGSRRERADALLGCLGRAWDRLADRADVDAALDDYGWRVRGSVKAFWLWSIAATKWLDDTEGMPHAPLDLRLRTPGTIAVHGQNAPGYLRPEFDAPNRREVLTALGVSGEPTMRDLVERLRKLRADPSSTASGQTDAALTYQAISERLARRDSGSHDISERELRGAFAESEGLILTKVGWRAPSEVFAGPPLFRDHHAFVPQVPGAERLWRSLQVREPTADDCIRIILKIARSRTAPRDADSVVVLETLRLLSSRISIPSGLPRSLARRLAALPLWTSLGWTRDRPVYTVDDPALLEGLRSTLPVWLPGGDAKQFEPLLAALRVISILPTDASVVDPEVAQPDPDATELFAAASLLLHEDLARNDALAAAALGVGWDELQVFEVRVDPDLRVRVAGIGDRKGTDVLAAAKADPAAHALYLREAALLRQVDGGGRAVAGLFSGVDQRQLAQAWLAACVAAEEGRVAQRVRLAEEEAAAERGLREREMADRTAALGQEIATRLGARSRTSSKTKMGPKASQQAPAARDKEPTPPPPRPRYLVDPDSLVVVNAEGREGGARAPSRPQKTANPETPLPPPNRGQRGPRGGAGAPRFTDLDKETVGLELVRKVLAGDADEIVDLRAQHGVGADAIDSLDRFFELKVHLGDEPDQIRLEESQVRRALSTRDFFLVVVSNVEGINARPKVRIIVDPVHQLSVAQSSSVSFAGVRSAQHSLIYELGPAPKLDGDDEQDQADPADRRQLLGDDDVGV